MSNLRDITNSDYKNRNKREISWEEIAKVLSHPKDEVSNKWNLLRQQFRILSEDSETSIPAIITKHDDNYECSIPLTCPKSSPAKETPKRRKMDETNVHCTALIKQACEILANTKDDDEFELWGKSVVAALRNFPDVTAVPMAKSKMNQIMASLEAGELNATSNSES
ncbi:hypothetical protein ACLKA6_013999 [Drosophila palustris]